MTDKFAVNSTYRAYGFQFKIENLKLKIVCILLFLMPLKTFAVDNYGAESVFTSGSGSRASAMGGAFTAISDDASGTYYNPAGLINLEKQQLLLMHYPMHADTLYNSVSYAQPILDFGTVGLAVYRLRTDGILVYDSLDIYTGTTYLEEYKATFSYARKLSEEFTAAGNINMFTLAFQKVNAMAFGADVGLLYEPFDFLAVGLMLHNIIKPELTLTEVKEEIPQSYSAGVAYRFKAGNFAINAAVDAVKAELVNGIRLKAGAEVTGYRILSIRAGYDDGRITFGGGIKLFDASVDYVYSMDSYMGALSRFAVSYNFGMTLGEQKIARENALKEQVKQLIEQEFKKKEVEKAKVYLDKAYALYKNEKYDDAMDEIEKALTWAKDYSDAKTLKSIIGKKLISGYYDRALKSYKNSDLIGALEGFKNVYAIDKGFRDVSEYIGRINQKLDMKDSAREVFTKGIESFVAKQYDDAIDFFERAQKMEPGNKVIKTYIDKAKAQMKRASGGRALTDEQADKVKKLYYAGLKMYTAGDLKGALRSWKEAIEINPDDIKVMKSIEKAQAEQAELQKRGIK